MLLIIPALSIRGGRCTYTVDQPPPHLLADPVQMAKLWRVQNAKTLVLVDLPSERPSARTNAAAILEVCASVDIPIQVDCSSSPDADVRRYLDCGVYRLIVGTDVSPKVFADLVESFGRSRLALCIPGREPDLVSLYADSGCCRFVVDTDASNDDTDGTGTHRALEQLRQVTDPDRLAGRPGRFTARGPVRDYPTLKALADQAPRCLDSVIIGQPLYMQAFPCQATWCWNQLSRVDLDCFSTATLNDPD